MELSIERHSTRTGNCFRAAIALEEAGLPYVVKRVDLRDHEQRDPAYLALNPRGKVPIVQARARAYERFLYFVTDVIAPNHAAFAVKALPESRDASALLNARSLEALSAVESFLSKSAFIAGDQFTLADISAYTITVAIGESLDWRPCPKCGAGTRVSAPATRCAAVFTPSSKSLAALTCEGRVPLRFEETIASFLLPHPLPRLNRPGFPGDSIS